MLSIFGIKMKKKGSSKTVSDLIQELEEDKDYVERQKIRDQEMHALEEFLTDDERPLVEELNEAGIQVKSAWDFVNGITPKEAIPILVSHLHKNYEDKNKEGIIRALTVREAKDQSVKPLIKLFKEEENENTKWIIGNALSVVADDSVIEDIIELASDERHGSARGMLLIILKKSRNNKAKNIFKELKKDKNLVFE